MSKQKNAPVAKTTDSAKLTDEQAKQMLAKQQEVFKGITFGIETITPEQARQILKDYNTDNRGIRVGAYRRFSNDILNDNWLITGDTIVFDKKGVLRDGQHRLMACANTNATMIFFVVRGIPEESFVVMDSGAPRTPKDAFGIAHIKNPGKSANCINAAVSLLKGKKGVFTAKGDTNLTASGRHGNKSSMLLEYYKQHEDSINDAVVFAEKVKKERSRAYAEIGLTVGDLSGLIVYLISMLGHQKELVYSFFDKVYLLGGEPVDAKLFKTLRSTLSKNYYDAVERIKPAAVQSYIAKAWNMFLAGKTNTKITLTEEESAAGVKFSEPTTKAA